ncbi:MAG: Sigma-54-dependent Fis family transcriptional regulator [Candidatus Poribacteria bacterium]|nr:Sigma-54-dependent Fis family transcriptional regulator [Candidatus Poribacteria bacterium]
MSKILVVDDEEKVCWAFEQFFKEEGHTTVIASNAQEAIEKLTSEMPELVIMDIKMPGQMDGLDALAEMKRLDPDVYIIIMTAYGTMQTAIKAMQSGAYDYIVKPLDLDQVKLVIEKALKAHKQSQELAFLRSEVMGKYQKDNIIGNSPKMQEIYKLIGTLTTNDVTVLIEGETGVGKELVAKAIHYNSNRSDKPFIAVNCAALTESLLESELFGHDKGSFTGAIIQKQGKFEVVQDGTILLDEIGDISPNMQTRLLRILDKREYERVGSNKPLRMDARIIALTNRDLSAEVKAGNFRADLYYRLRVMYIYIPPLRERKEDIPLLVRYFIDISNENLGKHIKDVNDRVIDILMDYEWRGNVRELENIIKSAVVLCKGDIILPEYLPDSIKESPSQPSSYSVLDSAINNSFVEKIRSGSHNPYDEITEHVSSYLVQMALGQSDQNQVKAASILGISRTTLRKKMKEKR